MTVGVLAHAAAAARTGRTSAGRVMNGRSCSGSARLVLVRRDLGAREVRGAHMPHYAVGVKVAVKVLCAAAVATPAEKTDEKDGDQTGNATCNAADDGARITAAVVAGTGSHGWRDEDGRLDGSGGYLAIGSGRPV